MNTVLLIAHGTREPRGNDEATTVARALAERSGRPVRLCFLEHAEPGIPDAIAALYAEGLRSITALPIILTAAGHVKRDIPAAIALARARFPDLQVTLAGHLGAHSALIAVLADRFDMQNSPPVDADRIGLVVIGRGATDPEANAEIYRNARLLWEARPVGHLAVGFMGMTRPTASEALTETVRALTIDDKRPARILVIPYFLFQGLLLQKLAREASAISQRGAVQDIRVAASIGVDKRLIEALLFRLEELHE